MIGNAIAGFRTSYHWVDASEYQIGRMVGSGASPKSLGSQQSDCASSSNSNI